MYSPVGELLVRWQDWHLGGRRDIGGRLGQGTSGDARLYGTAPCSASWRLLLEGWFLVVSTVLIMVYAVGVWHFHFLLNEQKGISWSGEKQSMLHVYESAMTALFFAALGWALWSRNPINLGAVLGGFMLSGFDWLWCSRGFWNATVAPSLMMIPGIHVLGQQYPISICFLWVASKCYGQISRSLGKLHFPVIFVAAAALDLAIEVLCVSRLGVWTYHQSPRYLFHGVPWSNTWLLGGLLTASYYGLARVQKWAAIPKDTGLALNNENTWKGVLLSAGTILTSAFLLGVLQLFWWSATHPWIESGRQF